MAGPTDILLCLLTFSFFGISHATPFKRFSNATNSNAYNFVNPLIGSTNQGNVFAGASLPFGMAKAVADVTGDNEGGYASDGSPVTGFSHMHDSGTGGSPSLGNFPLFPYAGCAGDTVDGCAFPKANRAQSVVNGSVVARPGYFSLMLNSSIQAEMTTTNHTALYRFTFPMNTTGGAPLSPLILADLTDLSDSRLNGSASVDPTTGRQTGTGTFQPSFGAGSYVLHFCADYQGGPVRETGAWVNNRAAPLPKNISLPGDTVNKPPLPAGVYTRFNATNQILARVGVSFISVDQACSNAQNEIPMFDFNGTVTAAENAWKNKLSVVSIDGTGVDNSSQVIFWSGFYRALLSPQDYTGENPLWNSTEPYYDSYYCIWDSFRSIHPFITLVDPYSQTQMIRSLIDIYRHEGKLPDCRMSLCKGLTQGGSNADVVLTDAYLKNITQDVDWATAYEAVVSDAEDEPKDWTVEGRGGLASWKTLGYIPADDFDPYGTGLFTRSVSRTMEYAYNDFCISEMARDMGKESDYMTYMSRSTNWQNLYNANQTSSINGTDTGFKGFVQPRYTNGTFGFQDPIQCSPLLGYGKCGDSPTGGETYEAGAWLYTFFAPHDMATLIQTLGGNSAFVSRLDFLHESGVLDIGDEQGFLPCYQYHYAGNPGRSAYRIHQYIPSRFNTSLNGLAGNDDSGAMGSFIALSMLGIFPNPGQDVYFITPPFFQEVSLTNPMTGKTATIRNINFDAAYNNIYIQNATLNGAVYTKNYLTHDFFLNGGTLELTLGAGTNSSWGTGINDVPPSLRAASFTNQAEYLNVML